mmetsp:Transcript_59441/g.105725  ORF Transcript_59441/g.105725 Transcript_59441/m.105725 type:complete len:503 (-) Transcript_59441:72-1580(-)
MRFPGLLVLLAVLVRGQLRTSNCTSHRDCFGSCTAAGNADACDGIACQAVRDDFRRCVCAGGAALRSAGSCQPPVVRDHVCSEASHQVLFNVGTMASPELDGSHLRLGSPSPALSTVLVQSLAAGLSREPHEVEIVDSQLLNLGGDLGGVGEVVGLTYFDLNITFCAVPAVTPERDIRGFESKFISEAQSFAVFHNGVDGAASIAVLTLTTLGVPTPDDAAREPSRVVGAPWPSAQEPRSADDWLSVVWWLPWALSSVAVVAFAAWLVRRRRGKLREGSGEDRMSRYSDPVLVGPDGSQLQWLSTAGAYAIASHSFSPEELAETEDGFKESCLKLQAGELLEVEASGGLWLYGKLVEEPEKSGFFPMNRVAWLGHPLQDDLAANTMGRPNAGIAEWSPPGSPAHESGLRVTSADAVAGTPVVQEAQGPRVYITVAFVASEVDDATGRLTPEQCLTVAEGEVVQVTAAGAGWLYGHVVGESQRAGYFPEDRATWDVEAAEAKG